MNFQLYFLNYNYRNNCAKQAFEKALAFHVLICHTTIVFTRYIVLSWQDRCHTDERTLGGLFYGLCDEVNELDWAVTLQQLIELLRDILKKSNKQTQKLLKNKMVQWIAGLASYIRAYLPSLVCES